MMNRVALIACLASTLLTVGAGTLRCQQSGPIQKEVLGSGGGALVDEFSGSFSYGVPLLRVPGPAGGGYTITLSYQSGSPFNEASWVGYGWSLGPSGIMRDKHGFPDDWADTVLYRNKTKRQYTVSATIDGNLEILSQDQANLGSAGVSRTAIYNSQTGYSVRNGINAAVRGIGGLGYTVDEDGGSFQGYISPVALLEGITSVANGGNFFATGKPSSTSAQLERMKGELENGTVLTFSKNADPPSKISNGFNGGASDYNSSFLVSIPPLLFGVEVGASGGVSWYEGIAQSSRLGLGYMYSGLASADRTSAMDYYSERDIPYSKESLFLPMPFSNADNFVLGGGSFRMYFTKPGGFRPGETFSRFLITRLGAELHGGGRWGLGGDVGAGEHSYTISSWENPADSGYSFPLPSDTTCLFRMNNDLGGNVAFSDDLLARNSAIDNVSGVNTPVRENIFTTVNNGSVSGRATYIASHTNKEMLESVGGVLVKSFNKNSASRGLVARNDTKIEKGIGEFAVTDQGGNRYVYGLPVYSRNEKKLSFGLEGLATQSPGSIRGNMLAYKSIAPDGAEVVIGQESSAPYAASYLLTEITTNDYVDLGNDGPTFDDAGGYTIFHYRQVAGSPSKTTNDTLHPWFQWRAPYNGLGFAKGDLADPSDDMGTMESGEREQYYLESIETKTHIAIFVTNHTDITRGDHHIQGSGSERHDGYPQIMMSSDSLMALVAGDSAATAARIDGGTPWRNIQERLERIELYAKNLYGTTDSLLQTVYFDYDYSLRKGMPNSLPNDTGRDGLLTLRRVWSQDQAVASPRISPYVFGYDYRTSADYGALPTDQQTNYADIIHFGDRYSAAMQNPGYSLFDADRWGSYQHNGEARMGRFNPWVDQHRDTTFDPAAWQLKTIRTPSGGELHIQYEQKDYAYVQDRPAAAMVSLMDTLSGSGPYALDDENDNRYYLRLSDIGIDSTSYAQVARVRSLIERDIVAKKKMYFQFLYALAGSRATLDSTEYRAGYINGFGTIDTAIIDTVAKGLPGEWYALRVTLRGESPFQALGLPNGTSVVPKRICWDYVRKNKNGKLDPNGGIPYGGDIGMISKLIARVGGVEMHPENHCKDIDYANSYLRIPVPEAKLGGGIRVKRLLNYDPGIESDPSLYGVEYTYKVYDEGRGEYISSGVAINEPAAGREENALVEFNVPELNGDRREKFIAGKDLQRFAGPLGESLLPGASVGYSRVVMQGIYTGRTNPGFAVNEYLTAKDYPFDKNYPGIGKAVEYTPMRMVSYHPPFLDVLPWFKVNDERLWVSQGYRFLLNRMHGRVKRAAQYGGEYGDPDSWALTALREYNYFEPGEKIPTLHAIGDSVRYEDMGEEMEIVTEGVGIKDLTNDAKLEGDVSLSLVPPWAIPSGMIYLNSNMNSLQTSVTTKVVSYPAIVKNVLSYGDGVYHYSENLAFNADNGMPLISRGGDGFNNLRLAGSSGTHNGNYYTYTFPASHQYPGMGQKAAGSTNTNQVAAVAGALTTYGENLDAVLSGTNIVTVDSLHRGNASALAASARIYGPGDSSGGHPLSWRPISGYLYRSDGIVGASKQSTSERNFSGGILNDFTLFNWQDHTANDTSKWLRTDTVIRFSPDGYPIETRDGLGIYSATKLGFGYNYTIPVIQAVNAHEETLLFSSFEEHDFLNPGPAHSGKRSVAALGASYEMSVDNVVVYNTFTDTSLVIRFWVKFGNYGMKASPQTYLHVDIGGQIARPTAADEVAQVGEWTLYEINKRFTADPDGDPYLVKIGADSLLSTDSIWIDDLVIQPVDAVVNCYVYDINTLRPLATLDDRHFGIYNQYNAEGRLVRQIAETVQGRKTVVEVSPHIPTLEDRDISGGMGLAMHRDDGDGIGRRRASGDGDGLELPEGMASPNGSFDLLNIELGREGRKVEVLEGASLPDVGKMKPEELEKLAPAQVARLRALGELRDIDSAEAGIVEQLSSEEGADDAVGLIERRKELRERREALLRQLGIDEDEARRLYRGIGASDAPADPDGR